MKWLDSFIYRCLNRARERDEIMPIESARIGRGHTLNANSSKRVAQNYDDENVIHFTLYGASGGKIVEAVRYDPKNDRERVNRYVITDNDAIGDVLAKVVTMECLK